MEYKELAEILDRSGAFEIPSGLPERATCVLPRPAASPVLRAAALAASKQRTANVLARCAPAERERRKDPLFSYLRLAMKTCRRNAAAKGRVQNLSDDDLWAAYRAAEGKCAVTGVPFTLDRFGTTRAPYAPSIDRIDTARGYEADNFRVVCQIANLAMNMWGAEVLVDFIARTHSAGANPLPAKIR